MRLILEVWRYLHFSVSWHWVGILSHSSALEIFRATVLSHWIVVWLKIFSNVTAGITCNYVDCTLQWRYNGRNGVSNHQPHRCLLNLSLRCRSKKTSKVRVTGLCAGNSPVTGEFPAQMASKRKMFPHDDVILIPYNLLYNTMPITALVAKGAMVYAAIVLT